MVVNEIVIVVCAVISLVAYVQLLLTDMSQYIYIYTFSYRLIWSIQNITDDLKDQMNVDCEGRTLSVRANMLVRRFAQCTVKVKVSFFSTYCKVLYAGALWARHAAATTVLQCVLPCLLKLA